MALFHEALCCRAMLLEFFGKEWLFAIRRRWRPRLVPERFAGVALYGGKSLNNVVMLLRIEGSCRELLHAMMLLPLPLIIKVVIGSEGKRVNSPLSYVV